MLYHFDELTFQIVSVDRFFHDEGFFEVKARPYAALSFRVSGTGCFRIGDRLLRTDPGDVLFIPADTPYEVEYSVSESIVVHFYDCNYTAGEVFGIENSAKLSLLFAALLEEWSERHSVNQVKSTVYRIFETVDSEQKRGVAHTAFATCLSYIEEHYCEPSLHVDAICEAGFISPSGLQRAFLQHFGVSPKQYVIKLRLHKALQLLVENKLSVKEVAFACGFTDEKYFSRAFKAKYGYPPSQLRDHMLF